MMQGLLRKMGMAPPASEAFADDQTYSEAAMDNAIVDSGKTIDHLSEVAAVSRRVDDKLRAGIDRMKMAGADPASVISIAARRRAHL